MNRIEEIQSFARCLAKDLIALRSEATQGAVDAASRYVARKSSRLGKIAEIECAVELSEARQNVLAREGQRLKMAVRKRLAEIGLPEGQIQFNGDPRGYAVQVVPYVEGNYNTWGDTYGV
jgi:hypothetical protein